MASVYDLKPRFQALLRPTCRALVQVGISANHVTIAALVLSLAAGTAICIWPDRHRLLLILPAVLFVRMALNAIDGMIAREHDMRSSLGAVLNELGDVISDTALYLPLALVPGFTPWLIVLIVVLAIISEMTGVLIGQLGGSRRNDGPMGKSDRAFLFGAIGLLLGAGVDPGRWLTIVLWAVLALLALTIVNRARRGLADLRSPPAEHATEQA